MISAHRPKRQRDYKAEYARRVAKGTAAGRTRQEARGHHERERGQTEAGYRRERSILKYGATPAELTRLRRAAREHILAQLGAVGTRAPVYEPTVRKGLRMLHARSLETILQYTGRDFRSLGALDLNEVAVLLEDDELERNPFWYH